MKQFLKNISEIHTLTNWMYYSGLSHMDWVGMRTLDKNNRISLVSKNFLELALVPSSHHKGTTNYEKEVGGERAKATCKTETPEGWHSRIERGLESCAVLK